MVAMPRTNFARDVTSAMLFLASATAVSSLLAFIARTRLGAPVEWIGFMVAAGYIGYLWNLFFAGVMARIGLRRSITVTMAVSAGLIFIGAFQQSFLPYCIAGVCFLVLLGLCEVQYNTLVPGLYEPSQRPKRLSTRQFAISISAAVLAVILGRMCSGNEGHRTAFVLAGTLMVVGALVFRGIRMTGQACMEPFSPLEVWKVMSRDVRFGLTALVLTLYGWAGAGSVTAVIFLYQTSGLQEYQVGRLEAVQVAGMLLGLSVLTPHLRFSGSLSSFRLCFVFSTMSAVLLLGAALLGPGGPTAVLLSVGKFLFGLSGSVFTLGVQTTGLNLATDGRVTLYVNALMVVLGLRGIAVPILTAYSIGAWGLQVIMLTVVVAGLLCIAATLIPAIRRRSEPD